MNEGAVHLTELHEPGGPGIGVDWGNARHLFCQPVANPALGRKIEEREGLGLEVRRLTGRHGTTVRSAAEADPPRGRLPPSLPDRAGHLLILAAVKGSGGGEA